MRASTSLLTLGLLLAPGVSTAAAQVAWEVPRTPHGHPDLSGQGPAFDQNPYEYGCHGANHALQDILRGARYSEAASR